ncbi:hypothetical protein LJ739_11450 [Aestuariibacter halophilus]|uniref:ATP synthase F1 complex delta/epsilon subunit N-terminal domain-containing protein n=1 Tax=Fluctibacter halophilus TaxID=226011 RepID=A0ABS8G8L0_9ALTE|nr:hypothetical protein [Aestuariibacter halophilus]MCC2616858.1 hypothetical protein [Aestuariibacter halophilus]
MTQAYTLRIYAAYGDETVHNVSAFIADDDSGRFCLLPGHADFMTVLSVGMATLRFVNGDTDYLATPGGLLHCRQRSLTLHTHQYWRGREHTKMVEQLRFHFSQTEDSLYHSKSNLERIEQSMMRHMFDMERWQ